MTAGVSSYHISAKYYDDFYFLKTDGADQVFYIELAKQYGGPVLELACGTGRVLLPIAQQGIAIHGVDSSVPMLDVLNRKLKSEPKDVCELISIMSGDMHTFRSNRKYPLVIIPFLPMQQMYTVEDQLSALNTAAFHLDDGGVFAFDIHFPSLEWQHELIGAGTGDEFLELRWRPEWDRSKIIHRYFRKESVDKINQTFNATLIFRTFAGENLVNEEAEPFKMSWYTYPQLRALFMLAGLEVVEEYGSFDKTPLDNTAEKMIFLLRKAAEL